MEQKTIQLSTDTRGVATLMLDRPDKHHAMSRRMIDEMRHALDSLARDKAARVIVLASTGPTFCAGGDLDWMRDQMAADRAGKISEARALSDMLHALNTVPKPVIARVQGPAYGGGIGLLCACDIVIASERCKFALTETRLGLIPATIGPFVISRLGDGAARQMFITGTHLNASAAYHIGLVSQLVADDASDDTNLNALDTAVEEECMTALRTAPGAMARAKALALALGSSPTDKMREASITALADCWESSETQIGVEAFFSKTPPPWVS